MIKKLNYEDFFKNAILKLRDLSKSRGIHSVFSGFNQAFREYFEEDPVKITQELVEQGKIKIRPVKRGVMIYLPGEAPRSRADIGKKALSTILNEPSAQEKGLVDIVVNEISPGSVMIFPKDFLDGPVDDRDMCEIQVPGTPLLLDPNTKTIVVSPKRHFRYSAKNPPEAKYIVYAHKIGQKVIKFPKDNQVVFKAVKEYEKYCHTLKNQCFNLFLQHTNDEDLAELLTQEIEQKFDLRALKISHQNR